MLDWIAESKAAFSTCLGARIPLARRNSESPRSAYRCRLVPGPTMFVYQWRYNRLRAVRSLRVWTRPGRARRAARPCCSPTGMSRIWTTCLLAGPHSNASASRPSRSFCPPANRPSRSRSRPPRLYDELVTMRADRHTVVVALGGGVVGDLAGFVAATFARGLPLLMLPTTLLAQVDSSVGGKVGINHPRAKNIIGAFHQPVGVWIDTETLNSCRPRVPLRPGRSGQVRGDPRAAFFTSWKQMSSRSSTGRRRACGHHREAAGSRPTSWRATSARKPGSRHAQFRPHGRARDRGGRGL